ncbi:MAG: hypothetical protein WBK76_00965 [Candidatus Saccharimonadales bacterium]
MGIIISDFDNTLFKRNHGLIQSTVDYLLEQAKPVFIVTYRSEDQQDFIAAQLAGTGIKIIGYGFAGSRKKDPLTKQVIIRNIAKNHHIDEILDDDADLVVRLKNDGFNARRI